MDRPWRNLGKTIPFAIALNCAILGQAPGCAPPVTSRSADGPRLLYTDIRSGPISGGEGNLGIYVSIFGVGLWASGEEGRDVLVRIGDHPAARILYKGISNGRPDIQQITVQVGPLPGSKQGVPLPIVVETAHGRSKSNLTFTPNPGTIYFADNLRGSDSTARPGEIRRPYRHVQCHRRRRCGIWPHLAPGDFVVLRGSGKPWREVGSDGYFVRFLKSGTAPTGKSGSGPISIMGYPGEDTFIDESYAISPAGGFSGINGPHGRTERNRSKVSDPRVCEQNAALLCSQWITISNLRIEGGGHDGPINLEIGGNHWRVINNILTAATAPPTARSGGIAGDGIDAVFLGNSIHAIHSPDPGLENHGIYIDGPGSYEIAYNYIFDVPGGSGFQVYGDETATDSYITDNVTFHHNWIDHVAKYCINLADHSGSGIQIYDNVSSHCGMAGLRINSSALSNSKIWHNTFVATDTRKDPHYGAIVIDSDPEDGAVEIRDNLFVPMEGTDYAGGDAQKSAFLSPGRFVHNRYFGGRSAVDFDSKAVISDPRFVDSGVCNFHLQVPTVEGDSRPAGGTDQIEEKNNTEDDYDFKSCPSEFLRLGAYMSCRSFQKAHHPG